MKMSMNKKLSSIAVVIGCGFATSAIADDYDHEVGLTYGWGSDDITIVSTLNGVPMPSLGTTNISSDSDNIVLSGSWYYSGLSDSNGPKARAAFLSRASSIGASFSRSDESGTLAFTGGGVIPPFTASSSATTNSLSVDLRHVWSDSGWYALAGIARSDLETQSNANGTVVTNELDSTAYSAGVGKYIGDATTIDLSIASVDVGSSNPTAIALTLSHVVSIGATWQFGADVAYAKSDTAGDGDSFAVRGALYPTADIEFGLGFSRFESGGGFDADSIEAFVGWFVRDHIEIAARYRQDDPDGPVAVNTDSDEIEIGIRMRF